MRLLQQDSQDLLEEAHEIGLTIIWCVLFNIGVIACQFRQKAWTHWVHTICGILITLGSLAFSLLFLIPKSGLSVTVEEDGYIIYAHGVAGLIIISIAFLQWFTGFFAKISQQNAALSPNNIIRRKNVHKIIGWVIGLACKGNVIMIWYPEDQYIIVSAWEGISFLIIIYLKFYRSKMEKTASYEPIIGKQIWEIKSIQEVYKIPHVGILEFMIVADYVYDIEPLRTLHPAGFQIIDQLSKREVDRFIYGMYSSEFSTDTQPFSHSSRFLDLVCPPVAKLVYPNPYEGFGASYDKMEVTVELYEQISSDSKIYMLGLAPIYSHQFVFCGYSSLKQYGQYYSLTIGNETTRLYTSVNCLCPKNIKLMKNIIQNYQGYGKLYEKQNHRGSKKPFEIQMESKKDAFLKNSPQMNKSQSQINFLPLLLKVYSTGKLTKRLYDSRFKGNTLSLSCPRGKGLQLQTIQFGTIIIVAGGTGLFPFMDFIDSLYKTQIIQQNHQQSQRILTNDPILRSGAFKKWNVLLLLAIQEPSDIHPLTLEQLAHLSNYPNRLKCVLKIKNRASQLSSLYKKFEYTSERFEEKLSKEIKNKIISKIWICGPPQMNSATANYLLTESNIKPSKIVLI